MKLDDKVRRNHIASPAEKLHYTFADCLAWDESERVEIVDGKMFMMVPLSRFHQEILMELTRHLPTSLKGRTVRSYPAPFGMRLFENDGSAPEEIDTVVELDIFVVCDKSKLDEHGRKGAPDLIMEILSPSSLRYNRLIELNLY